ncbi:hypothetical protein [Massilia sp. DD77]|uniref:hypothetical protein n=1 Tax=Massilia sp. DD77 TaxID=3109349 RepID=UPI002FFEBC51
MTALKSIGKGMFAAGAAFGFVLAAASLRLTLPGYAVLLCVIGGALYLTATLIERMKK